MIEILDFDDLNGKSTIAKYYSFVEFILSTRKGFEDIKATTDVITIIRMGINQFEMAPNMKPDCVGNLYGTDLYFEKTEDEQFIKFVDQDKTYIIKNYL